MKVPCLSELGESLSWRRFPGDQALQVRRAVPPRSHAHFHDSELERGLGSARAAHARLRGQWLLCLRPQVRARLFEQRIHIGTRACRIHALGI